MAIRIPVRGTFVLPTGAPAKGAVRFTMRLKAANNPVNNTITVNPVVVTLDTTGSFSITLQATDDPDISPSGTWTYRVEEDVYGNSPERIYDIALPVALFPAGVELADLAPSAPAAGGNPAGVSQVALDAEIAARIAADTVNANAIQAETIARLAADVADAAAATAALTAAVSLANKSLVNSSAAAGVISALRHGVSTTMQVIGDSTGDSLEFPEWFELLGNAVGARNPTFNVLHRKWNTGLLAYSPYVVNQVSSLGERWANFNVGGLIYTGTSVLGDLRVTARLNPTNWSAFQTFASKYDSTINQRGWQFNLTAAGRLQLIWSANGTAATGTLTSTVSVPFTNGNPGWVRVDFDVDNGAAGNTATFSTSVDGVVWTVLGAPVITGGVTSLFNNTSVAYQLGSLGGAALTQPYAGRIGWVEIQDGFNGAVMAPPMPDSWDQASSAIGDTILYTGGPNLLMNNGSASGQNSTYFTTNIAKLLAPHGQDLLLLSTGHNESSVNSAANWITIFAALVNLMKTTRSGVPVGYVTQNPTRLPISANNTRQRAYRTKSSMTWARSQTGVYPLDTYPAFTNLATQLEADGLHPNVLGNQVWATYLDQVLFNSAS